MILSSNWPQRDLKADQRNKYEKEHKPSPHLRSNIPKIRDSSVAVGVLLALLEKGHLLAVHSVADHQTRAGLHEKCLSPSAGDLQLVQTLGSKHPARRFAVWLALLP